MTLKRIHNPFHQGKAFYHDGYVESFLTANSYEMKLKPQQNVRGQADGSLTGWTKKLPFYTESNKLCPSLVAQWLRICLPMQGTRVRALVWEDPTCRGATGPVSYNY